MKQYIHKPTGDIYRLNGAGGLIRIDNSTNVSLPLWIKDNSKDWEELKEEKKPEWTILSFREHLGNAIFSLQNDGTYINRSSWSIETLLDEVSSKRMSIHSVRRESDDEVFTVGDKTNGGTILEIVQCGLEVCGEKKPDFLHIVYAHDLVGSTYPDFKDVQKVKPKEWEVTAFRNKNDEEGVIILKHSNGKFGLSQGLKEEGYYLNNRFQIYSVKRLSDGVEFKIGDRTKLKGWEGNNTFIDEFRIIEDNSISVKIRQGTLASTWYDFKFESLMKQEKLFTPQLTEEQYNKLLELLK